MYWRLCYRHTPKIWLAFMFVVCAISCACSCCGSASLHSIKAGACGSHLPLVIATWCPGKPCQAEGALVPRTASVVEQKAPCSFPFQKLTRDSHHFP
ncbi:hypothetical protein BDY21DRAFT_357769 [Lineolata rhizophorae]|uniref:Secreted protein n=1 Tax=Lineolata rhizophorae TaxID=578093 RepID=A0A6A6NN32_9PEZI|nr:hypothetical protein BDY21DRAFT_357769 [Lineolata rhizophorae]